MTAATTFTSPHPSSPWTTLPSFASSQPKYTFSPDAFSDFDSPSESDDVPTLFYKPTVVKAASVDYFSFQPHGIRSPYLPEDYDSPVEEEGSAYDDDSSVSESSTLSTSGTLVDEDEDQSFSLEPVFEEKDDVESGLSSPIHIELVSSFPSPPTLFRSRSSSPSSSSSSEPRTPSVTVAVSFAHVFSRKRHSTVFAAKQGTRRQSSLEAVSFSRWQEEKVHADTPFPAEGEQEET